MQIRIGQGYDLHRLRAETGAGLYLGGFLVRCNYVAVAHSDGDVLCHAVIDSLLGALALGDIGTHFSPQEKRWRNADSREMLRSVYHDLVLARGYQLLNLDCTVVLQEVRLRLLIDDIRNHLLQAFDCRKAYNFQQVAALDLERISVKAKTKEGVDAVGRGEAVEVFASCLLQKFQ